MPLLNDQLETTVSAAGGYQFSAVPLKALSASEYTLINIGVDVSGSTQDYADEMEKALAEIVRACLKSPRRENLLLRVTKFATRLEEVHGFKLLSMISPDDYKGTLRPYGSTALFLAALESIEVLRTKGKELMTNTYLANAVSFIITDGGDRCGGATPKQIGDAIRKGVGDEDVESCSLVLITIDNPSEPLSGPETARFIKEANITQHVDIGAATAGTLAKLAAFVSRSISSASQSLGTGGPSQPITFTV